MPGPDFSFYEEATPASKLKARIVSKYFWAWCKAMLGAQRSERTKKIRYVDLFAGPGTYAEGTKSTPLLVLSRVIGTPEIRDCIEVLFNDRDARCVTALQEAVGEVPGVDSLRHPIRFLNQELGESILRAIGDLEKPPTLYFVDPWGYKGLSVELLVALMRGWGCDCVFFFNYNRINAALENPQSHEHMNDLFGKVNAEQLRSLIEGKRPHEREAIITEEFASALKEAGIGFVLPFSFRSETGGRTSHHLVFASKNQLGYKIMKDIMARESSEREGGVASFEYTPVDDRQLKLLFALSRSIEDLISELPLRFSGKSLRVGDLIDEHHVDTPYIEANYKEALLQLEESGTVIVDKPRDKRIRGGKVTLGVDRVVTFLPQTG